MRKILFFLLSILAWAPASVLAANPAVSISKPAEGECIKGGTTYPITWVITDADHGALSFSTDGSAPPSWSANNAAYFAHPVNPSPFPWQVPLLTVKGAKIWMDLHDSSHASIGTGSSGSFSVDSSAPTSPALTATPGDSSVNLSWSVSKDDGCKGLAGYHVYRGDTKIKDVGSSATTYTDNDVKTGSKYAYKVVAYDDFASTDSNTLSLTAANGASASSSPAPSALPAAGPSSFFWGTAGAAAMLLLAWEAFRYRALNNNLKKTYRR